MVRCGDCGQEMRTATTTTCTFPYVKLNGKWYERNTSYFDVNKRCHDCNIVNKKGNIHHFGCDIERCPRCKRQLMSCDCTGKEVSKSACGDVFGFASAIDIGALDRALPSQKKKVMKMFDVKKETGVWN